jgi:hypothetical protein
LFDDAEEDTAVGFALEDADGDRVGVTHSVLAYKGLLRYCDREEDGVTNWWR